MTKNYKLMISCSWDTPLISRKVAFDRSGAEREKEEAGGPEDEKKVIKNVGMAHEQNPAKEERAIRSRSELHMEVDCKALVSAATDGRGSVSGSYHKP